MIFAGKIIVPEALTILPHYCSGNGDELYLEPDYFKSSPVVQNLSALFPFPVHVNLAFFAQ